MKDTTFNDLFYNIDDIRNLFTDISKERYYKNYRIISGFPNWLGEKYIKAGYFKKIQTNSSSV